MLQCNGTYVAAIPSDIGASPIVSPTNTPFVEVLRRNTVRALTKIKRTVSTQ
jgi:hypothetical protein